MNIHDDHMYHGAALIQIAEHEQFTAINSLKVGGEVVRVAYEVNNDIAVYLKYATTPTKGFSEYPFTFTKHHLDELATISKTNPKTFIALVCVKDRAICCISYSQLRTLVDRRAKEFGGPENQYVLLVTAPENKSFRVYVNTPGKRKQILGKAETVARKAFPSLLFA